MSDFGWNWQKIKQQLNSMEMQWISWKWTENVQLLLKQIYSFNAIKFKTFYSFDNLSACRCWCHLIYLYFSKWHWGQQVYFMCTMLELPAKVQYFSHILCAYCTDSRTPVWNGMNGIARITIIACAIHLIEG